MYSALYSSAATCYSFLLSSTPLRRRNSSEENEPDSSRVEEGRLRHWGFRTGAMFLVRGEKVGMEVSWATTLRRIIGVA